jgi:hypothetical protein
VPFASAVAAAGGPSSMRIAKAIEVNVRSMALSCAKMKNGVSADAPADTVQVFLLY